MRTPVPRTAPLDIGRHRPGFTRSTDIVWRATRDRVLVRRVQGADGAELVGLAALVWVAADTPSTVAGLASELDADETSIAEAVSMLTSAGWLNEATP